MRTADIGDLRAIWLNYLVAMEPPIPRPTNSRIHLILAHLEVCPRIGIPHKYKELGFTPQWILITNLNEALIGPL